MVFVDKQEVITEEEKRLRQDFKREKYWKKWGSYVAERQWATGSLVQSIRSRFLANIWQFVKITLLTVTPGRVSGRIRCIP